MKLKKITFFNTMQNREKFLVNPQQVKEVSVRQTKSLEINKMMPDNKRKVKNM